MPLRILKRQWILSQEPIVIHCGIQRKRDPWHPKEEGSLASKRSGILGIQRRGILGIQRKRDPWHPKEAGSLASKGEGSLASKGRGILGIQRKRDHGHPKEEGGLFRCSIQRKRNSSYAAVSVASRRRGIPLPLLSVLCPPPPPLCFVNISPSLLP